jgi:hypothetical protein
MAIPHRTRYYVMATTWTGLRRRVLEIRTALVMELDGRRARKIARDLGGHYLLAHAPVSPESSRPGLPPAVHLQRRHP